MISVMHTSRDRREGNILSAQIGLILFGGSLGLGKASKMDKSVPPVFEFSWHGESLKAWVASHDIFSIFFFLIVVRLFCVECLSMSFSANGVFLVSKSCPVVSKYYPLV